MRLVLKLNVSILILYDIIFTNMSMNVKMLFIGVAYADPQNPILKIL